MATRLKLRKLAASGSITGAMQLLDATAGTTLSTDDGTTTSGAGLDGITNALGTDVITWISDPLNAVVVSGTITVNLWMAESSMSANAGAVISIFRVNNAGTASLQTVVNGSAKGTELPVTTRAAQNWTVSPASATFAQGERIAVQVGVGAAGGTKGAGFTFTLGYDDDVAAADGDSWVEFTETITEIQPAYDLDAYRFRNDDGPEGPVFPSGGVLDSFTRSNVTPPGGSWSGKIFSGNVDLGVVSNRLQQPSGSSTGSAVWNPSVANDQEFYATLAILTSVLDTIEVWARASSTGGTTPNGYCLRLVDVGSTNSTLRLFRISGGTYTALGSLYTGSIPQGNKIGIQCIGNQIKGYEFTGGSWVLRCSATDATHASGKGGMLITATNNEVDDFGGGDVSFGATWAAALNTPITGVPFDTNFRLRVAIQETAGGTPPPLSWGIQYRRKPNGGSFGSWWDLTQAGGVGDSETAVWLVDSTHVTDGASTVQQITSGTYLAGRVEESNTNFNFNMGASVFTEHEYALIIPSSISSTFPEDGPAANGDTIEFRIITGSSTPLDTYTNTPSLTVGTVGPPIPPSLVMSRGGF